ncbi:hypothetical protein Tco_0589158 [Tanacetum coccineum]
MFHKGCCHPAVIIPSPSRYQKTHWRFFSSSPNLRHVSVIITVASTSSSINLTSVSSLVIRRSKASKSDLVKGWVGKTVVGVVAPFDRSGDPDDVVMEELKDEDSDLETESFLWLLDRNIFFGLILAESFMIFGKRNEKKMEKWRLLFV